MKKLIYTYEGRLKLQIGYNEDWAKAVNLAIDELKKVCEELTDEQIKKFLASPSALCTELVEAAKKEYDSYMASLPKAVRLSTAFSDGGVTDKVNAIYKNLQRKKNYRIIDKTTIKEGICLLDDEGLEALKEECSVFGGEESQKIADKAIECAKLLNELDELIHLNPAGAECVESFGRWNGVINFTYDRKDGRYSVNFSLIPVLDKDKKESTTLR